MNKHKIFQLGESIFGTLTENILIVSRMNFQVSDYQTKVIVTLLYSLPKRQNNRIAALSDSIVNWVCEGMLYWIHVSFSADPT